MSNILCIGFLEKPKNENILKNSISTLTSEFKDQAIQFLINIDSIVFDKMKPEIEKEYDIKPVVKRMCVIFWIPVMDFICTEIQTD